MKKYTVLTLLALTFTASTSFALTPEWTPTQTTDFSSQNTELFKSFENYASVPPVNLSVPTVLEVDFNASLLSSHNFGVFNQTTKQFVPSAYINRADTGPRIVLLQEVGSGINMPALFDKSLFSKQDFYLKGNSKTSADLFIRYSAPIRTNSFTIELDANVALPDSVSIFATINNSNVTLVSKIRPTSGTIKFPETTATEWRVYMEYTQPLRASEVSFLNLSNPIAKVSVRFLATPDNSYAIYLNQDADVPNYASIQESGNLIYAKDFRNIGILNPTSNVAYVPADTDKDGIPDSRDNCQAVVNPSQEDANINGVGDVCDDFDTDGVINSLDNCSETPNRDQRDTDGDKVGDLCDPDESRLTEKYPFVVWFGIGFAGLVFLVLLFIAGNRIRNNQNTDVPPQVPPAVPPQTN